MSETLTSVIVGGIILLFLAVFPLAQTAYSQEDIVQTSVQTLVSNFVNTIAIKGKITQDDYENFLHQINSTGNTYDVEIEVRKLDENPRKKTILTSPDLIGENLRYSVFTTTILGNSSNEGDGIYSKNDDKPNRINGEYILKKGDEIIVIIRNTNITLATQFKNLLYQIVGENIHTIEASATALIINDGHVST